MNYLSQSWLINRRHALRAMGTCIALPMLECMTPLKAAEKVSTPRRSAFIYLANGVHSLNYQITESGPNYKFSRSLKPLEKHRNSITRNWITVFFQRFEGTREFVVRTGLSDLVIEWMNTVGKIDKSTPSWGGNFFSRLERCHAFKHRKCDTGAHCPQGMSAID